MSKLKLYSNCITVKGQRRSLICDLQREKFKLIPNDLFDLLSESEGMNLDSILNKYNKENQETVQEYLDFLLDNEFIFLTENPEYFPELNLSWDYPSIITNAIADRNDNSTYRIKNFLKQLSFLNCKHLELRFFSVIHLSYLEKVLEWCVSESLNILSIDILFKYDQKLSERALINYFKKYPRFNSIKIYNSPAEKVYSLFENRGHIIFIKDIIVNKSNCGIINRSFFTSNTQMFSESKTHNSCLNRKISIDINGDIKNCPSMPESYGNIKDTTLKEAINKPGFKKYWNITKDDIEVCKDCEFRYVCTDCRAYTERTKYSDDGLDLSKPLKCGYNPYTNEWAEWSTNPLKQKAIEYYGMEEIINNDQS